LLEQKKTEKRFVANFDLGEIVTIQWFFEWFVFRVFDWHWHCLASVGQLQP
jgi:hypothetical protein